MTSDGPIVFGRMGELYVADGTGIGALNIDCLSRTAEDVPGARAAGHADAMVLDEASDQIVALDQGRGELRIYRPQLVGDPTVLPAPADLLREGRGRLCYDPSTRGLWFVGERSEILRRLSIDTAQGRVSIVEKVVLPAPISPDSLNFSDLGRITASMNGDIVEFRRDKFNRFGAPVAGPSIFAGYGLGSRFVTGRSRSSLDPNLVEPPTGHSLPNPDDQTAPECGADVTGPTPGMPDGVVDARDMEFYIEAWRRGDARADIDNGSGQGVQDRAVTDADMAFFLQHYNAGC